MKAILLVALIIVLGVGLFLYAGPSPQPAGGHTPHSMQPE